VWQGLTAPPPATHPLTFLAGVALLLAGCAAVGWAASVAGPVSASREWRAWVLSTPLDRNAALRRRAIAALGFAVLPGLAVGALVADGIGVRRVEALTVVLAAGFGAVTATAVATCWQRRVSGRAALTRWQTVIAAFIVVAAPLSRIHITPPTTAAAWWWCCAAGSAAVAAVGCWVAMATLGAVPMTALTGGAGSAASLLAAAQEQSLAPLAPLLARPDSRRRGHAPYRPLTGTGQKALAAADRRRVLRNRPAITRWAVMSCLPYISVPLLGGVAWGPAAVAVATYIAAVAAVSGLCTTARQLSANPPLADRYGLDRDASKRTAMAVPYLGALGWGVVTAPALLLERPAVLALIIPVAALAVAEYRSTLPPYQPTYLMGQQYSRDLTRRLAQGPAQYAAAAALVAVLAARLS